MNEGDMLWAWVTEVPGEGVSQVGAMVQGMHTSLTFRNRGLADLFRPLAKAHAERSGQRVWLRSYAKAADHGDA